MKNLSFELCVLLVALLLPFVASNPTGKNLNEVLEEIFSISGQFRMSPEETIDVMKFAASLPSTSNQETSEKLELVTKVLDLCEPNEQRCVSKYEMEVYGLLVGRYSPRMTMEIYGEQPTIYQLRGSNIYDCVLHCENQQEIFCNNQFVERVNSELVQIDRTDLELIRSLYLQIVDFGRNIRHDNLLAKGIVNYMRIQGPSSQNLSREQLEQPNERENIEAQFVDSVVRPCNFVKPRFENLLDEYNSKKIYINFDTEIHQWFDMNHYCTRILSDVESFKKLIYEEMTRRIPDEGCSLNCYTFTERFRQHSS